MLDSLEGIYFAFFQKLRHTIARIGVSLLVEKNHDCCNRVKLNG
jgi:hypothetical protein